jgi:LysR family transcriptional regulator, cys regulon transcriptional activator
MIIGIHGPYFIDCPYTYKLLCSFVDQTIGYIQFQSTRMNLQQLRYLRETIRNDFNLTTAAAVLFTSQPGISKAIRELEDELGVVIFKRQAKRLLGLTEEGVEIAKVAERLLTEADNLKRVATEFKQGDEGELQIAATHTQARYTLPAAIMVLKKEFPKVVIRIRQGTPSQIVAMLKQGEADFGIATEALSADSELTAERLFSWQHVVIAPPGHAILNKKTVSPASIVNYPIVTYGKEFAGRSRIDAVFAAQGLTPNVVLEASDSDVIKTYVALGLGLGLVSELAVEKGGAALRFDPPLFDNQTYVAYRKGRLLKRFEQLFIKSLAEQK